MSTELALADPWWLSGWSSRLTPSGMGRAAACIRSEAMPHVHDSTPHARKGTIVHKFLADVLEHGRDLALGMVEDVADVDWLSAIDVERLPAFEPQAYHPEVAIAYSPGARTARALGKNLSREQSHALSKEGEVVGIIDVLGATDEDAVVQDYKSGWGYVEPAEVNWQLRTYALLAARWLGKTGAVYSVIRVRDSGSVWFDTARMDELDLLAHEEALLDLLTRREEVRRLAREGKTERLPPLVEGRHCRYCPAFSCCPAKVNAVLRLGSTSEDRALTQGPISAEEAARAWQRVKFAQKTLERYEAILKDLARQAPIPLGDGGEVLGEREMTRETIIPERARAVLERQYGPVGAAVAGEATESKSAITKASLKRALKRYVLPTLPRQEQKISALNAGALRMLREGGAISATTTRCVTEWTPRALSDEPAEDTDVAA
jgi:hypothetical protein